MLGMVFFGVPGLFGGLVWLSYRRERSRVAQGREAYAVPGRERW